MNKQKTCPLAVLLGLVCAGMALGAEEGEKQSQGQAHAGGVAPDSWVATDALGRTLPTAKEAGPRRPGRFVGIFYFLWLNDRHNSSPNSPRTRYVVESRSRGGKELLRTLIMLPFVTSGVAMSWMPLTPSVYIWVGVSRVV